MKSESAFPRTGYFNESAGSPSECDTTRQDGMSLRDYAEIQFIKGMLADSKNNELTAEKIVGLGIHVTDEWLKRREERKE